MEEEVGKLIRRDADGHVGAAVTVAGVGAAVIGVLELHIAAKLSDVVGKLGHEGVQVLGLGVDLHGGDQLLVRKLGAAAGIAGGEFLVDAVEATAVVDCAAFHGIHGHAAAAGQDTGQHQKGDDASDFHMISSSQNGVTFIISDDNSLRNGLLP